MTEGNIEGGQEVTPCGPLQNARKIKVPKFKPEDNPHPLLEESSFAILFPEYRKSYLEMCWDLVEKCLSTHHIKAELHVIEGSMCVRTTRQTRDPSIILKARDLIRLLSRSVPFEQAQRVLEDDVACDIIKMNSYVDNLEKFGERRQRIIGPNGCTLKAIEVLTKCYVLVQGQTVAAVGPYKGLQGVRRIVKDIMQNILPVYSIERVMIHRELEKDPKLKNESWARFLPRFDRKNQNKRKQPKNDSYERKVKKLKEKQERAKVAQKAREEKLQTPFIPPPTEPIPSTTKTPQRSDLEIDVNAIKKKVKSAQKKKKVFGGSEQFGSSRAKKLKK